MLDDRKTASLPDSLWRRFVELILLAKEYNKSGLLPLLPDIAWRLRIETDVLRDDLSRLALVGLVELVDDKQWKLTNFQKRQEAMGGAERVARHRDAQKKRDYYEPVTNRYTESETESETESDQSYAAAVAAYEANIGVITKKAGEMIDDWIQEFGLSCTLDAITESGKRNAKTPAYVDKVIRTIKESATANGAYGEFTAWHAGRRSFGELPAAVQDKIRTLGGDGIRKQPAHYYKKEFQQVAI